jgi:hypothetical protein
MFGFGGSVFTTSEDGVVAAVGRAPWDIYTFCVVVAHDR